MTWENPRAMLSAHALSKFYPQFGCNVSDVRRFLYHDTQISQVDWHSVRQSLKGNFSMFDTVRVFILIVLIALFSFLTRGPGRRKTLF
jgi:hypothetical protein